VGDDLFKLAQQYATAYAGVVKPYLIAHNVRGLFGAIDHCAIKAENTAEYDSLIARVLPLAESVTFNEVNKRRIAAARLYTEIDCGSFGKTNWLEIMEPRPTATGIRMAGLDHIEVYNTDLERMKDIFDERGIRYVEESNDQHRWLSLRECAIELKVTDTAIAFLTRNGTVLK
jgi:hypothetical protein